MSKATDNLPQIKKIKITVNKAKPRRVRVGRLLLTPKAYEELVREGKIKQVKVPTSNDELHKGLDMILSTRTVSRAFGEILLQTLWLVRQGHKVEQVDFSRRLGLFLDDWAGIQKGGAA